MNIKKILPTLLCFSFVSFCMIDAMSEPQMVSMATVQLMMKQTIQQAEQAAQIETLKTLQKNGLGPKPWLTVGTVLKYGIPAAAIGLGGYYLYKKSAWIRQLAKYVTPVTQAHFDTHLDARVNEIKNTQNEHHQEDMNGHQTTHQLLSQVATKSDVSTLGQTITDGFSGLWTRVRGLFSASEA